LYLKVWYTVLPLVSLLNLGEISVLGHFDETAPWLFGEENKFNPHSRKTFCPILVSPKLQSSEKCCTINYIPCVLQN